MAYVVPRASGAWELRESRATPDGPRSKTLASFRTLTPEVVERALSRASAGLEAEAVIAAARRAGAPVAPAPEVAAAERLLAVLRDGAELPGSLRRLLLDALDAAGSGAAELTATERAAAQWSGSSAAERGEALYDLLLLADRIDAGKRRMPPDDPGYPRLETTIA